MIREATLTTSATTLERVARRALAILLMSALVLTSALSAGRTYLWCAAMARAMDACCCVASASDELAPPGETAALRRPRCCKSQVSAVSVARAQAPTPTAPVPPAAMAAAPTATPAPTACPAMMLAVEAAALPARHGWTRAGPRSASETCVHLQVFRC